MFEYPALEEPFKGVIDKETKLNYYEAVECIEVAYEIGYRLGKQEGSKVKEFGDPYALGIIDNRYR